jgi:hypothetical protein
MQFPTIRIGYLEISGYAFRFVHVNSFLSKMRRPITAVITK